ncbi:S8 family peptidase [Rhizobium sp. 9140]|uniref:S8 family peptidase n=1 Tax=Rhizobium sp. 9140 TaxID=1761900 RepID=UPI0007924E39|nr:S8 family serine peptidase [Rhizobium sp. 9140]CZT33812.1 Subtilase family protein [Rhizobium sp. 9140]
MVIGNGHSGKVGSEDGVLADSGPLLDSLLPRLTGSILVTLDDGASVGESVDLLTARTQSQVHIIPSFEGSRSIKGEHTLLFEDIGVALFTPARSGRSAGVMAELLRDDIVLEARPEFFLFSQQEYRDTTEHTWGVGATKAWESPYTGLGIRIAILDTGIDLDHPDFKGRSIVTRSFVNGEDIMDAQGHGTHCAGTAAGRARSPGVPRYGVAPDASLYIGKVLNNRGFGAERDIITGIRWAIEQRCEIISMSLGSPVQPGASYSRAHERLAKIALDNSCLIMAAAGNESNRTFNAIAPVGWPANVPSILAVGAVDPLYKPASFSNGGINPDGGELDLVAPGVNIFSSVPRPRLYTTNSGTSMACPHAAGVAALWAESDPSLRGRALWNALKAHSRKLPYNVRDVGAGLVAAPPAP